MPIHFIFKLLSEPLKDHLRTLKIRAALVRDNKTALVNSDRPCLFNFVLKGLFSPCLRGRVPSVTSRSILGGYLPLLDERQFTPGAVNCQLPP